MKPHLPPRMDRRRTREFMAELQARARAWIPDWAIADDEPDFGRALLQVAARFSAEVAERLDGAGEKLRDGLFDWLGVHGEAARPARAPVAFKLGDKAVDAVLAPAQTRLQADVDGASVVFETETDVQLVPSKLTHIVGVEADRFHLPPPGLASLEPLLPLPEQWLLKSFAAPGAARLQLDPAEGLSPDMVLQSDGQRVRITQEDKGLVTIEPPLRSGLAQGATVRKLAQFSPFDGLWNDEQLHALYLGGMELFDITAEATFDIVGAQDLAGVQWEYWGKKVESEDPEAAGWQELVRADEQKYANALTLRKPEGAIEPREVVPGKRARWIRAVARQVDRVLLAADRLSVRINYTPSRASCQSVADKPSVGFEAMSNTTPLVVDGAFYPLGREPRQFDAFYIGSAEAFSKKDARVQLCFEMADLSFQGFACLRTGPFANTVLAGVTRDGGLQLLGFDAGTASLSRFRDRPPLRPPSPAAGGATVDAAPMPLRAGALAIWDKGDDFVVAVAADDGVWCWREVKLEEGRLSGWTSLPAVPVAPPPTGQATPLIDSLVYLPASAVLLAVRDAKLYACDPDAAAPEWTEVAAKDGPADVELTRIASIFVATAAATVPERIVGVARDLSMYAVRVGGAPLQADCTTLRTGVDPTMTPAAILRADDTLLAVAVGTGMSGPSLLAFLSDPASLLQQAVADAALGTARVLGGAVDAAVANVHGVFAACLAASDGTTRLVRWSPFEPALSDLPFSTHIPAELGPAAGVPTVLPAHLIVPVLSSQVLVARFNPADCAKRTAPLMTAIITRPGDPLQALDQVAFPVLGGFEVATAASTAQQSGQVLFAFDVQAIDGDIVVYPAADPAGQSAVDPAALDTVLIAGNEPITPDQTRLLITTSLSMDVYQVDDFDNTTRIATLDRELDVPNPLPAGEQVSYRLPAPSPMPDERRVVPLLELDPANSGHWDAALLQRTLLALPGGDPVWQRGHAFHVDGNGHPLLVDLATPWVVQPPINLGRVEFYVDEAVRTWSAELSDTTSNPALSWEYWNGTGWWNLGANDAGTQHLKRSGAITFKVPADLRPTDWSGKTSHWIRARLIGGDYGREEVTVVTTPTNTPGETRQTIERNTDGIRAPYVARLHVSYATEDAVLPTFVLAQDSGSILDQSDANRTPNAIVEAFVPLPVLLGRLSGAAVPEDDAACAPECACSGTQSPGDLLAGAATSTNVVPSAGRAFFLGFKGPLSGGPVRLYLRVAEDASQVSHAAVRVDALVADRFVPLVVEDDTRGLGESGMLTLVFDAQPTPRELFGTTLRWLRITPSGDADAWSPTLLGAHLNAAWATAAETMAYERLGSSEGAPDLTLVLARPPVLRGTLELRVREPLGEEERADLTTDDPARVLSDVPNLPGDWVRWEQVFDPADEDASRRVYALDEATGEVVFGDGTHGMIPPVGRDSIVAFRYQRTERAADGSDRVPANAVAARAKLNLASPVSSVEAVSAADQAAGGAPPEDAPRILRFGTARLRHRNRAISASDLEDLALQSSPDIAQARCFVTRGGVRLVVVMRGGNPVPNAAQRRELERLLLGVSPVALGALRIAGPTLRWLGAQLRLRVVRLDDAGAVSGAVRGRIKAWFDPVTGGADGDGWPLGRSPDASDIALALVDTPRLAGVLDVVLHERVDEAVERAWPASIRRSDLVVLRDDAWQLVFDPGEEGA
ncbi:hypothetical protein [Lysobacter sp. FW306-1B-D06B]|uniref:hypothetical protein n=1 Tax=Lysobacter sp. FW306-1B-D06B TaxID=3140250 RepID=UPI0031408C0A